MRKIIYPILVVLIVTASLAPKLINRHSENQMADEPVYGVVLLPVCKAGVIGSSVLHMGGTDSAEAILQEIQERGFEVETSFVRSQNLPLAHGPLHDEEIVYLRLWYPPVNQFVDQCGVTMEQALELLAENGLEQPTHEHALRFAEQYSPYIIKHQVQRNDEVSGFYDRAWGTNLYFPHEPFKDAARRDSVLYCQFADRTGRPRPAFMLRAWAASDAGSPSPGFGGGAILVGVRKSPAK